MAVTTPQSWRDSHACSVILPECGNEVLIRPMDAWFFFKTGKIPNFLAGTVQGMIEGTIRRAEMPQEMDAEKTREFYLWLDELVKFCFVEPKVVDEPKGDDELGIDEIGRTDKLFIYYLFGSPANVIRNFRERQEQSVALVDAPKANGHTPQPSLAHTALGR